MTTKKRYASRCIEPNGDGTYSDKGLKIKGLQVVRRDNILLVKEMLTKLLNKIILDGDVDGGIGYMKNYIKKLINGKVPMDKLIVSKKMKSGYTVKPAHVHLAERMALRDPLGAPRSGDRVQYVFVENIDKTAKQMDRIESPDYVRENNVNIDYLYYLDHQVKKPILGLLSCIIKDDNGEIYPLDDKGKIPKECEKKIEEIWEPLVTDIRKDRTERWTVEKRKRRNAANKQKEIDKYFKKLS
jgi:DNA polymerase delta subunit 1